MDKLQTTAKIVQERIDALLQSIKANEFTLAGSYVKLGAALFTVRENKYWSDLGFDTFGSYIEKIRAEIQAGRTQLYLYISVVDKLLPSVSEDELVSIGVSKAAELQRVVMQTGNQPPREIVEKALDPTTSRDEIKGLVFNHLHIKDSSPDSKWRDLSGCYMDNEEWKEVTLACRVAEILDPPISEDLPPHARKKEVLLRFAREFLAEYSHLLPEEK